METRSPARHSKSRRQSHAVVEIEVADERWQEAVDVEWLAHLARTAAGEAGGEIVISLSSDAEVRPLNKAYRGVDKPTNVLSFPAPAVLASRSLGDIIIAYETAEREARDLAITLADHTAHLVVHGVLHLLGHDHGTDAEAEAMEGEERRILAAFGIADPYLRLDALEGATVDG